MPLTHGAKAKQKFLLGILFKVQASDSSHIKSKEEHVGVGKRKCVAFPVSDALPR